ncbi:discoidin domain-containing protein [Collinsella tanakaei]|uniref:discoidin domain-containing protein n=1 Tax=Collinsella tanakaei TaxID=626935 RepID=UPI002F93E241
MAKEWLKRCCVGAMTAVLTVSSLPMAAFAKEGGVEYSGGAVTVNVDNDTATIGNGAISRTFSFADNQLKTTEINNKRANKKMQPGEGSEEFIIKRTKEDHAYQKPIDQKGWTVTADSEENNGEAAPHHGHASNLIDNNSNTFWHTAYKDHPDNKPGNREMPHEIVIDLGKPTSFKSFSYDPRYTNENGSNINGNIKDYTLWVSTAADAPSIDGDHADAGWTEVKKGLFGTMCGRNSDEIAGGTPLAR